MQAFISSIANVLIAIVLLIVAFIVAKIVKSLIVKLLKALNIGKLVAKTGIGEGTVDTAIEFIGKLVYFVVFLLFLPGVLDRLGMDSVSAPITSMVNTFLAFIPKLVGAGILLAIGLFVARMVRDLLKSVLKALKIDTFQEKAGIEVTESNSFSSVIANVIYGVIILVVVTAALDGLGISAISEPADEIVATIFAEIPYILAAIVVIGVGVFVANLVANLLDSLLKSVGADTLIEKITGDATKNINLSKGISLVVKYVLVIIFVVEGIDILGLPVLTNVGATIIGYMPEVLSVVLILAIAVFAAGAAESALTKRNSGSKVGTVAVKAAIYVLAAFLCLSQLGVASTIVESTFILIVAALAVAFALSFGIGGRKFAEDTLAKLETRMDSAQPEAAEAEPAEEEEKTEE
ncbi:MAG: mechanosensitive ion channel [Lachnospiraceae bacterium]|nr:mechanosensitive ion channel [Lachnospiraceae bacterium]